MRLFTVSGKFSGGKSLPCFRRPNSLWKNEYDMILSKYYIRAVNNPSDSSALSKSGKQAAPVVRSRPYPGNLEELQAKPVGNHRYFSPRLATRPSRAALRGIA
jgi:hypothetical protein